MYRSYAEVCYNNIILFSYKYKFGNNTNTPLPLILSALYRIYAP